MLNKKKSLAEVLKQAEALREHDGRESVGDGKEEKMKVKSEEVHTLHRRLGLEVVAEGQANLAETWQVCLVRALVEMPPDVAEKVIQSLPREVLVQTLEASDDPFVKLALKLLALSK